MNDTLNAFLHIETQPGGAGPLSGMALAIKDNIHVKGMPTTCASKILKPFVAPYDATAVERLRAAGADIVGKTNLDEFAMGSSTENSAFGPVKNPRDLTRVTGGSSGGSAAAVAAGLCDAALGSDTGGSIRQPAALCGVVGFKPTYGVVSRYGLVAFASSLDQIGPITKSVGDAARIMSVIAGHDPRDSTSAPVKIDWNMPKLPDFKGLTFAYPKEFRGGVDSEVQASIDAAARAIEKLGGKIVEASLPTMKYGIATYYLVATSEASSNLARYDGIHYGFRAKAGDLVDVYSKSRRQGFGDEVTRRIILGTFALSSGYYDAYYLRALKARRVIKNDFDRVFAGADFIIGPTTPTPAFKLGEKTSDPLTMYLSDIFTVTANLAGLPAISIPCGFTKSKLPIGLQLHAKAFDDARLLAAASTIERTIGLAPLAARL